MLNLDEEILMDCFKDLKHKFIIITKNSSYRLCGKGINKVEIHDGIFYVDSECDNLEFCITDIKSIQILWGEKVADDTITATGKPSCACHCGEYTEVTRTYKNYCPSVR